MERLTRNIQKVGRKTCGSGIQSRKHKPKHMLSESPSKPEEGCGGASPPTPGHHHLAAAACPSTDCTAPPPLGGSGCWTLQTIHTGLRGTGTKQQGRGQARAARRGLGRSQGSQASINRTQRQQRFLPALGFCPCCSTSLKRKSFYQRRRIISIISRHLSLILTLRSGV